MKRSTRITFILIAAAVAAGIIFLQPPMPQSADGHQFADQRIFFGIPNFMDVISNLAFALVGAVALFGIFKKRDENQTIFLEPIERWPWVFVFLGTFLSAFGSTLFHWNPSNTTLAWDRIPISIIVMALLAAAISERIGVKTALRWLAPLLLIGIGSVLYWKWTESRGSGDLRLYALVQFLPLLLIPLMILLFEPRYTKTSGYFSALALYLLAKLTEALDSSIFAIGGLISGHTLKHLLAAFAIYQLYQMILVRQPVPALRPLEKSSQNSRKKGKNQS